MPGSHRRPGTVIFGEKEMRLAAAAGLLALITLAGCQGQQGQQGAQGPAGPAGPAGSAGAVGPTGPAGPAGATGAAGPAGPAGPAGAKGDPGTVLRLVEASGRAACNADEFVVSAYCRTPEAMSPIFGDNGAACGQSGSAAPTSVVCAKK